MTKLKKRAVIIVDIDLTGEPEASSTSHRDTAMPDGIPVTVFHTNVRKSSPEYSTDGQSQSSMRTSLAHELAHAVAYLAETEANQADPRSLPIGNRFVSDPASAVRASEREAWDIAKEIDPGIDHREADKLLASYDDEDLGPQMQIRALLESLLLARDRKDKSVLTVN